MIDLVNFPYELIVLHLHQGQIVCFKTNALQCTLLARWDIGYKDQWLILTDLQPTQALAVWYGLRPSSECVYRDVKFISSTPNT